MSSHTRTNNNDSGERIIQSMQFENGVQKGVKTILTERGKHKNAEGKTFFSSASHVERKWLKKEGKTPALQIYVVGHLYSLKSRIF